MNDTPAISVQNLHKSYGAVEAVRGIDLEIDTGEVFGLLGPNGAGKTTTIEILEGLRPRTSGKVSVLGFDPAVQMNEVKDRIGVCLQATNLPDKMKVYEALELFSAFYTRTADPDRILGRLQLSEKKDAFYKSLSGGQKQRVALGLALLNDPTLLFLDEPTTGLDPQVRHEIHGVIQELKENRRTILVTTHYIEEAERLCDRVAIIDAGKIIELGTPREIQGRVLGHTVVEVKTNGPMPLEDLPEKIRELKHATSDNGCTLSAQSDEPAALIVDLVKWIDAKGLKLIDIHMKRPTLEDVFIELTGKKLRES
ncbi:MAG: ABC transporter ATP-binding protein [Acidobacteriaceae bacterium]|nr:ABC transporter ATP-binding protein [Acidobacteriaceae bacterium]MBV9226241.1 ABC transporter ATP-binding protein [Acidobacteriaceae bacterium]MBV9306328.1 ABC transporter ATP-binding protein [Acidobacteriaceae bacterium]